MAWRDLEALIASLDGIKVISTDVFDTLLLRQGGSEWSRIVEAERRFASALAGRGCIISSDILVQARLQAQKLAFRALNVRGGGGEARIADIIARQLRMLGLAHTWASERLDIELQVEKACLVPAEALGSILRRQRSGGTRIVAISDTTLPANTIGEFITAFHGADVVHRVYSSADEGKTKRHGELFSIVAASEAVSAAQMLHIGNDEMADHRVPSAMGIHACHVPLPRLGRYLSFAGRGFAKIRHQRRRGGSAEKMHAAPRDAMSFGREIFGPIVTQFCLLIWLYTQQVSVTDKAALLFCARGGVGIREAFERVLDRLGLPLGLPRDNILVSRLVAARAAVMVESGAALEELGREFRNSSFADVAQALGGRAYDLPKMWHHNFDRRALFALLSTESGSEVRADIQEQNELFARHFYRLIGNANRIVLCDTGLYGSTQRLLAAGFPDLAIETVQFARANYKKHGEDHFPRVTGLLVEQDIYSPFKVETCILRYWQLIESLFEPAIPSVRLFRVSETGDIVANSGNIARGLLDPAVGNPLLAGVLDYIDNVPGGDVALHDADVAWRRLKRAITRPTEADVNCLEVGFRSVDFGRSGGVRVLGADQNAGFWVGLKWIKEQRWREGAIVRKFGLLRPALLGTLEALHMLRGISAQLYR